jgi:hypothetical protein
MGHSRGAASSPRDERQTAIAYGMQKPDQPGPTAVVSWSGGADGRCLLHDSVLGKAQVDDPVAEHGERLGGEEVEPSPALAVVLEDIALAEYLQAAAP